MQFAATQAGTATLEVALEGEQLDEEQARAMAPPEIAEGDGDEFGVGGGAVKEEPPRLDLLLIIVRVVEVGLALVAVGAGVAALAMRRRGR
jgi:hypothetical protein